MNDRTPNRKRLLIYLLVTWLLLWSFIRMLLYPPTSAPLFKRPIALFIISFTGVLAIAWALGGPLLLTHWHGFSRRLTSIADGSRRGRSAVLLLSNIAWFLAYGLIVATWSIDPAMVDGPVIVLAVSGLVILVALARHKNPRLEPSGLSLTETRQSNPGRIGYRWNSLSAAVKYVLVVFILGLIVVLWFRQALFDANVTVYGGDIWNQHYNLEAFVSRLLRTGQIPFWNPYIYSGTPFLAHPQSLVFYPPQMILRLLPLNLSISWAIAIHVWIAGIGMFVLARWKGIQVWISFLCAIAFMLNGGLLLRIFAGHIWLAYALCWLPLVWLLLIVALDRGRITLIIAAAVGTSMIILTGHPAFPIYILLFFGFYWIWVCAADWSRNRSWRSVSVISGRFLGIIVLAFGLSAIQIAPALVMYSQVSLSEGYGAGGANFLAISLADLTALAIPNFYITAHQSGHFWELVPYMGVLFLLLVPLSYTATRTDWFRDFLSASALASMAIALGSSIGIYFVFYFLLPPLRVARIPPRSLVIFVPTITLLAGIGLQAVATRTANPMLFMLITRVYKLAAIFILGIALGVWFDNAELARIEISGIIALPLQLALGIVLITLIYAELAGLRLAPTTLASQIILAVLLFILGLAIGILIMPHAQPVGRQLVGLSLLVAIFALMLANIYHQGARPLVIVGFIVLVFLDLFISGRTYNRVEAPPVFYQTSRLALQDVGLQEFDRILSSADEPDQYMLGRVGNIDGYNSGVLYGYEHFLRGLSGAIQTSSPRILLDGSLPDPRALAFLGTRYIISPEPIENEVFEHISADGGAHIYENPGVLPRAFVVYDAIQAASAQDGLAALMDPDFDFSSQVVVENPVHVEPAPDGEAVVDIIDYSEADGSMLMRVQTNEPGILVLSEPYYSERSVWVDGHKEDMLRVNLGFIGVAVPTGTHHVELRYVPISLYAGSAVTAFSIMIVIVALLHSFRRRSRRKKSQQELAWRRRR